MSSGSLRRLGLFERIMLVAILVAGGTLRFSGLGQGIPFSLGVDEPEIVERAVRMMRTGDFHPDFFDYPTLYMYLQAGVAALRFMTGAMSGLWATLDQVPTAEFYLWGRAVTAALGTATIAIVFFMARRFGLFAAVVAASILAFQPMHVRESHYVLTDVPMAFFAALAMLLTLRAYEQPSWRAYLWPGIAAGLAAATKYNGGVALVLPLLALAMRRRHPDRLRSAAAAIGGAAGAFLLGAPYTVIDLPGFLNGFGALSYMYAVGPEAVEPVWMTYLKHLRINFGWPGVVLAAGSVGLAVSRAWFAPARERATWATLAAFVVIAFWLIAGQRLVWARYLLPILPPLAVLMGGAVAWIVRTVGRHVRAPILRWALAVGLFALVIAQPAMQATRWTAIQAKVGTAELTYRWVMDHIPAGSRVAIESRALLLPQARLRSDNVPRLIVWDLPHYRSEGYAYLIASSQAFGEALNAPAPTDATRAYRALFDRLELLVTILPTTEHPGEEWRVYRLPPE